MNELAVRSPARSLPWVRDFALVGVVTGFAAPYLVVHAVDYCAWTGLGGALAGAGLGWLSASLMEGRGRRWPKLVLLPLGLVAGALWGAAAGLASGLGGEMRDWVFVSALFGGIAGAFQLGWFWLAYSYRRVNLRSTWPFVTLACLLGPTLGWAAVVAYDLARRLL